MRSAAAGVGFASPAIQEGALVALFKRRGPAGGREILRRVPTHEPRWKSIIRQHQGRMTGALRDAVLGSDRRCRNGCQAAVWFREYDLIPTLLTVLQDAERPARRPGGRDVLSCSRACTTSWPARGDRSDRRDPQLIRRYVVSSLEPAVQRFGQHKRREVIEAFLLLASRDNVTLKQILQTRTTPPARR